MRPAKLPHFFKRRCNYSALQLINPRRPTAACGNIFHRFKGKPQKKGLILELMHFPEELLDTSEFKTPAAKSIRKGELRMAKQLIESMSSKWEPSQYSDKYHEALEKMIEKKIESGSKAAPPPAKKKRATNVVDLMSVLQQSLREKSTTSAIRRITYSGPEAFNFKSTAVTLNNTRCGSLGL
jgi:hypothetical protein